MGLSVSVWVACLFRVTDYRGSIDNWVLCLSKFVYYSGHPLLNDDGKFERITREYRSLIACLLLLTLKTLFIVLMALALVAAMMFPGKTLSGSGLRDLPSLSLRETLFPAFLLDWPFLLGSLLPILLLPFLRQKVAHQEYSVLGKFLHYLFLGSQPMAKVQFKLECRFKRELIHTSSPRQHVYVSGLARSGSTALMQCLGQIPDFTSLSYRNMPFLFMPQTGSKLSRGQTEQRERSHLDGMTHDLNSYEALEEPFWLHFVGSGYVEERRLVAHRVSPAVHTEYSKFRTLVAENKSYLAKNNNHLLRASSIHELDATKQLRTRTIIPFREPYAQAESLRRQHKVLSGLQSKDEFALDYMDFLVHHEFGLHTKTPTLTEEAAEPEGDRDSIGFWLDLWKLFYEDAFSLYARSPEFCFFCYEVFRDDPAGAVSSLSAFIDVDREQLDSIPFVRWRENSRGVPSRTSNDPYAALYEKMVRAAINHEADY